MRYGRPAKQRLWLGPRRYRRCCGNTLTNPKPKSYADSNSNTFCLWGDAIANSNDLTDCDRNSHSNGNNHSYCNAYCYCNGNNDGYWNAYRDRNGNGYGYLYAAANTHTQICA
jgi:hypothetical protein